MSARFGLPADHPTVRPDAFHWKYATTRDDCPDPRGWVVEDDGEIVAHMGSWPHWIMTPDDDVPSLHGLDWAAKPGARGAGPLVCRTPVDQRGAACISGGSDDADRVLATIGFTKVATLQYWARPARPFRQMRNRVERYAPLRLPRSLWWRYWPPMPATDWQVHAVSPDELSARLWPLPERDVVLFRRSAAFYRWLVQCPTTPVRLYRATGRNAQGYFAISRPPGVARIVDAWTHSRAVEDWMQLLSSAWETALDDPDVCEVSTLTGLERVREALDRLGFRHRETIPLRLTGAAMPLAASREFGFQWVDGDKCIWQNGQYGYHT